MRSGPRSGLLTMAILGAMTSVVTAGPKLAVTFKTSPVGGAYTPQNVVAVWIEGPTVGQTPGPFVKTIGRWAGIRKNYLALWITRAGQNDVDAVSGATRTNHTAKLTATWDLKDKLGALVPDGTYTVHLETADGNNANSGQNNQGTFTFVKGVQPQLQIGLTGGSVVPYTEVDLDFNPTAGECNNNVVEAGETCDPPGSCPVSCDQSTTTVCAPAVLVGSAASCTASCAITAITACASGDMCCPDGCTPDLDSDCYGDDNSVQGGCTTGGGSTSGAMLGFGLLGLALRVTRKRG